MKNKAHFIYQLIFSNENQYSKYYDIVSTPLVINNDTRFFLSFNLLVYSFQLFLKPTVNSTIIIPKTSNFTTSDTSYQYEENPCQCVNPDYLYQ